MTAQRPRYRRPQDFSRGRVARWPNERPPPQSIARRAVYRPDGAHKDYPSPTRQWEFNPRTDKAKCAHYREDQWPQLVAVLRAAIAAPVVSAEFRGEFPARAWAYVNGRLHEARLTNPETGEYHGFPLTYEEQYPDDPEGLLSHAPQVTIAVN